MTRVSLAALTSVAAIGALLLGSPGASNAQAPPDANAVYRVLLQGNEPQWGPDDALVTIVEFAEFECPFSARAESSLQQLRKKYGNQIRLVWINRPLAFHRNAKPAAIAALEAYAQKGNRGFWAMHDKLFANQRALGRVNLETYARELNLDMDRFRKALDTGKHDATIRKQQELADELGARGTPTFFINGRNLRGAQPAPAFEVVINEELEKAKALVKKGTPRAEVYAATIASGATAAVKVDARPATPDPNKVYDIPKPKNAPWTGSPKPKVVIQEFADFQCPFSARAQATMDQLMQEYGAQVQLVWRDYPLPFHKEAHLAAQAAREVYQQKGNKAFWTFRGILFSNQKRLSRADLEKYAQQIPGINMAAFRAALNNGEHQAAVDADMSAITKAGVKIGTPSFFINGQHIQGAHPYPKFKTLIEEQLTKKVN